MALRQKLKEQHPNWTSDLIPYSTAALDCLTREDERIQEPFLLAGISRDGSFGWMTRKGALEVFNPNTGERLAAWAFGAAVKDDMTEITAVTEYHYDNNVKLLVATATPTANSGLICLFDVKSSKIVKAVEIPSKVTALEPVTSVGADRAPAQILSEHLRHFCGVIAVGTQGGLTFLLDLNLDDDAVNSNEVIPSHIAVLDPRSRDVATKRYYAVSKGKHLILCLGDDALNRGYFYYKKPDGGNIKTFSTEDVSVSCLQFIKQTGMLSVGYNFGCFQLWRLCIPVLEYSSRLDDGLAPVTHFSYMEPENDPRHFGYLWVSRGPLPTDSVQDFTSSIGMFMLTFEKKTYFEDFGYLFEDLSSVCTRFEHDLTADPYGIKAGDELDGGSRVLSCFTVQDPNYRLPKNKGEESYEEENIGQDLSLSVIAWEAVNPDPSAKPKCFLALFDLNKWYHAQMPHSIRPGLDMCQFFAFCSLDSAMEKVSPDNILAVHVTAKSVTRFLSSVMPVPEQHLYPSSLAFDACCLAESGLVHSKYLGVQRQIISEMNFQGPECLANPSDLYHLCFLAGMLPRNVEFLGPDAHIDQKRDAVLAAALDNNQVSFLMSCVVQFAAGDLAMYGCTLKGILDWAWNRVVQVKDSIDRICVPLFDWSGEDFDDQTLQLLYHYSNCLKTMVLVFQTLANQLVPTTLEGERDLATKFRVVCLIKEYMELLLWFYSANLLPELPDDQEISNFQYCYPAKTLKEAFIKRRVELNRLPVQGGSKETGVLMIDGLIEEVGDSIHKLWKEDGGNGHYPPPSLGAILKMSLLDGVTIETKQMIILYLLMELINALPEEHSDSFGGKVVQFVQTFSIPMGLAKLVNAFWQLDHKEFEDALSILLDPNVSADLSPWQHRRILKAFLYQGKHKLALRYINIKKPSMYSPDDVKLKLTVLLANGLASEALDYQRRCRDQLYSDDLLSHLFLGCQQTKMVDQLLQLPLNVEEENHLVDYLKQSREPNSSEILVMHYLQRARVIEAIRLNKKLRHNIMHESDPAARERTAARNAIVDAYHKTLPRTQRKMAFETHQVEGRPVRVKIQRPQPLSVAVNKEKHNRTPVTNATLIRHAWDKVQEVQAELSPTDHRSFLPKEETAPFLCTPLTSRAKKRLSETTDVIFPSLSSDLPMNSMSPSPSKKPYGVSPDTQRLRDTLRLKLDRHKSGADALQLLHTPPVKRKTPRRSLPTQSDHTPQSILKVKQKLAVQGQIKDNHVKSLDMTWDFPTPPKFNPKKDQDPFYTLVCGNSKDVAALVAKGKATPKNNSTPISVAATDPTSLPGTPKLLRFAVSDDKSDSSKEASPAKELPSSPRKLSPKRSVKDRSPTPERMSPKTPPGKEEMFHVSPRRPLHLEEEETVAADIPMETQEVIDDDITFNFGLSQTDEEVQMDTTEEKEPSPAPELDVHDAEPMVVIEEESQEKKDNESVTNVVHKSDKQIEVQPSSRRDTIELSSSSVFDNSINRYARRETRSSQQKKMEEVTITLNEIEHVDTEEESSVTETEIENGIEGPEIKISEPTIALESETMAETKGELHEPITEPELATVEPTADIEHSVSETEIELDQPILEPEKEIDQPITKTVEEPEVESSDIVPANEYENEDPFDSIHRNVASSDIDMKENTIKSKVLEAIRVEVDMAEFKTPPRPSRVSVLPPTPPESHKGTPTQEVSPKSRSISPASSVASQGSDVNHTQSHGSPERSSRRSPHKKSPCFSCDKEVQPPRRATRSSSRSVSPSEALKPQTPVKKTPGKRGRPKKTPTPAKVSVPRSTRRSTRLSRSSSPGASEAGDSVKSQVGEDHNDARSEASDVASITSESSTRRRSKRLSGVTGPLSDNSFMMKLRQRSETTPSRDGSPDSHAISDFESVATVSEADPMDFVFSDPMCVDKNGNDKDIPSTPVAAFVFSPPATRSSRRRKKDSESSTGSDLYSGGIGLLPTIPQSPEAKDHSYSRDRIIDSPSRNTRSTMMVQKKAKTEEKKEMPKNKPKSRRTRFSKTHISPTNSPINFLEEVKDEELTDSLNTKTDSKTGTYSLRHKKLGTRKKKTYKI